MRDHAHLQGALDQSPRVQVTSVQGRAVFRLRSWLPRRAITQPTGLAGQELPSQVGTMISGRTQVLCVGPYEWLLVLEESVAQRLRDQVESDLTTQALILVDLTDGVAVFDVRGSAARELLSKGCGLDLDQGRFRPGQCARTRFAQIAVALACLDESPRFELYVGASYAHYLLEWLADAAAEFCLSRGQP